jgi:arginine decarboxylase
VAGHDGVAAGGPARTAPAADPLDDAPLLAAWSAFVGSAATPFTIPGHKGRAGRLHPALGPLLAGDVPLYGGLDTVKQTGGVLADAEARAARLWGADWCRFSVGGSTHANQALTLAVGAPGDEVLVTRAAHRSTLLGLVLAGLTPVWLPPEVDAGSGMPLGIAEATLRAAVRAHPGARAVFLVEPSYLGTVSDLPALVAAGHEAGLPVLVDQAWGAHFGFHPALPRHALDLGADALVTSAHKTLPAYSQASLVLARTGRLDRHRLERGFEAGHTTSPAGSILASIDASRALLAARGTTLLDRTLALVAGARERLREVPGVRVPGPEEFPPGRFDPAKLVVLLPGSGADGIEVERRLVAAGVPVEMADRDTVVPIVTLADHEESVSRLVEVLVAALAGGAGPARPIRTAVQWAGRAVAAMSPREAFFARHETVPAARAVGRVCAEVVAPYPPGVPVLIPGEVVTAGLLAALVDARAAGTRIAYAADPDLATLQVVAGTDAA